MSTVKLFAECFSSVDIHDDFVATPCLPLWQRWMEDNPTATRLFLRIYHPDHEDDDDTFLVPVGDPVRGVDEDRALYLPTWMIDSNKYGGAGEEAVVEIVDAASLPKATRIVLRPVDSALHEVDVVSVFEKSFSRLGVLQQGRLYLVPLEELGGFQTSVFVEHLEPAAEVYLDGDEVPLEFERAVDYVEPPPRVPTPIPAEPERLVPEEDSNLMVPRNFLGSIPPPTAPFIPRVGSSARSFVPFSGQGHVLGGK